MKTIVHLGEAAALYGLRQEIKDAITFVGEGGSIMRNQLDNIYCDGPKEYPTSVFTKEPLFLATEEQCRIAVARFGKCCNLLGRNPLGFTQTYNLFGSSGALGVEALWYCSQRYELTDLEDFLEKIYTDVFHKIKPYARANYLPIIDQDIWRKSINCVLDRLVEQDVCSRFVATNQLRAEISTVFGFELELVGIPEEDIWRIADGLEVVKGMRLTRPQRNLLLQQAVGSSLKAVLPRIMAECLQAVMLGNEPYVFSSLESVEIDGFEIALPYYYSPTSPTTPSPTTLPYYSNLPLKTFNIPYI